MEFLRFIMISGILLAVAIPLQLNAVNLLKFYDRVFPYSFLREGASYDNISFANFKDSITNEGKILFLSTILIILPIPALFASEFNYFFNLGFYLGFAIPAFVLLCRINVFGDNNVLSETGLGYEPLESWGMSYLSLFWFLTAGFSQLYFTSIPIYMSLVIISLALVFSMIQLFPDYINKILPYEIRSEKGFWTLRIITLVGIGIQWIVRYFLIGIFN